MNTQTQHEYQILRMNGLTHEEAIQRLAEKTIDLPQNPEAQA